MIKVLVFFQHVDIAALLIKYSTCVNATDKWAFTPLHEAAQKGRTQLCALLLAHGADPTMKNQEGQTPLDLATVSSYCKASETVIKNLLYVLNDTQCLHCASGPQPSPPWDLGRVGWSGLLYVHAQPLCWRQAHAQIVG